MTALKDLQRSGGTSTWSFVACDLPQQSIEFDVEVGSPEDPSHQRVETMKNLFGLKHLWETCETPVESGRPRGQTASLSIADKSRSIDVQMPAVCHEKCILSVYTNVLVRFPLR